MSKKKESQDVHILNVRVSTEIISWLDEVLNSRMYNSRSEAVRDFLRDYLKEYVSESSIKGNTDE